MTAGRTNDNRLVCGRSTGRARRLARVSPLPLGLSCSFAVSFLVVHADGVVVQDPEDPEEIAGRLDDILEDVPKRDYMARNGRQRVHDEFLIFTQLCHWLRLLNACATAPPRTAVGQH